MGKKAEPRKKGKVHFWFWTILIVVAANFSYHIYKNPIHVLSFFSGALKKTPAQTWATYGDIFEKFGDTKLTPPLLAALAQVESAGNPLAAPSWEFSWSTDLTEIFAPASTAFGLMQITRGTFEQMKNRCEGLCPRGALTTRARATDSVRLSANFIRQNISEILSETDWKRLDRTRSTALASVIHLCGPEVGKRLVRNGFRVDRLPRCGEHWPDVYFKKVSDARRLFEDLRQSALATAAR